MEDELISNQPSSEKIKFGIFTLIVVAIIFVVISIYVYHFNGYEISNKPQDWGPFGDFFGGVLNPILAFCSFIALLYTIHIQQNELALTRVELKRSVVAQKQTATFTEKQNQVATKQLDDLTVREKKNDVYQLIKSIDTKIKYLLDVKCRKAIGDQSGPLKEAVRYIVKNRETFESADFREIYNRLGSQLTELALEVDYLQKLLVEFDELSRHQYLSEYYNSVYKDINVTIKTMRIYIDEL